MHWKPADGRWMRRIRGYVSNKEKVEPKDVGFFNAGQKLYFWTIALTAVLFLITGLLLWFDHVVPRWLVAVSYVIHNLSALVMLAGFIIHIYEGTAAQPGTFQSMTDGTVTKEWAWTHHPAWYEEITGRDPRNDYELAREQQARQRETIGERVHETGERPSP